MFIKLQIGIVILFVLGIVFIFGKQKRKEKPLVVGLVICTLISAFISNAILGLIPLPTNEVIVTALGEKNEAAKKDEVSIISYLVGGKEYEINNPTEGKWFWKGDTYMWRNESDSRQPAGTTRSITLNIPYGKDRYIQFGRSQWNGLVAVTYDGETTEYDLYKHSDETILYAAIPDTNALSLYAAKFLRLSCFVALFAIFGAYPVFCMFRYDDEIIKSFLGKHWDKIYYIVLAILYIILMQKNSIDGSLWGDEIWELGWKYTENPYKNQYVYYGLTKLWLFIMPYGQEHLLLLPQIAVGCTIYLAGIIGNKINGKQFGVLFSSLVAFSLSIIYQCSMEYRVYAFLLLSVTFMFYTFVNNYFSFGYETYLNIFIHSLAITLVMDMHTFGVAVAGLMMVADFILLILYRRISVKYLLEFCIPGIYGIWWLATYVLDYTPAHNSTYATWMLPPNLNRVWESVMWLMGSSNLMFAILILGIVIISIDILWGIFREKTDIAKLYIKLVPLLIPITLFAVVYVYSNFINRNQQLFHDRYFISIVIFLIYISAVGLNRIIVFATKVSKSKKIGVEVLSFLIILLCISNWTKVGPWELFPANDHTKLSNYRAVAEYLMEQNDIYSDKTFFVLDHNDDATLGFKYYLSQNGTRDMIAYDNSIPKNINEYDTIYFSYVIGRNKNKILNDSIWVKNGFSLETDAKDAKVLKYVRSI